VNIVNEAPEPLCYMYMFQSNLQGVVQLVTCQQTEELAMKPITKCLQLLKNNLHVLGCSLVPFKG
jgi:sulfur relay (sulfurtransferase) DsrF/TusC family protein